MLKVNEIFLSIQGESSQAGLPCGFIRLTGCPLRCAWCDTTYAYEEGEMMTPRRAADEVLALGADLVEITGGEPLAQEESLELMDLLLEAGREVMLETSGALDISRVDKRVRIVMDLKCPSSGMTERMRLENLALLKPADEVKFVLAGREDYEFARRMIREHDLGRVAKPLLSTVFGTVPPSRVVEWMLADSLPARFQLQMHKYIWPPDARGV